MSVYYVLGGSTVKQLLIEDLYDLVELFQQSRPFDALVALETKWLADSPPLYSLKSEALEIQTQEDETNEEDYCMKIVNDIN